jgi:mannose-6-phosphate isomerase-like protein (cupin superfamily)
VQDLIYVLEGTLRIFVRAPEEEIVLTPGVSYIIPPRRPHRVTNAGDVSATFFVIQGIGEHDFVRLA